MTQSDTLIIGAGIGGLAAALRLSGAQRGVHVIEASGQPGGKLRTVPSAAGPVDAGPTVLTLRGVFEDLFAAIGERFSDHVSLTPEPLLARHWWPDGSSLDLHADPDESARAIRAFAGRTGEAEFRAFSARTRALYETFLGPVMRAPRPDPMGILTGIARTPQTMTDLMPGRTLWRALEGAFTDPRLRQLFGRYATYVGGSPFRSPALLMLIWQAEAAGVWRVRGGMHRLATAMETLAASRGVTFSYGVPAAEIVPTGTGLAVRLADGRRLEARNVVFNGDPRALHTGLLGPAMRRAVRPSGVTSRALSAWVWSFAATPSGRPLAHHNVFFNSHYRREFAAIEDGRMPGDPALYVCAQDRGTGCAPGGPERFEIIMNGAPTLNEARPSPPADEDFQTCQTRTFTILSRMGLDIDPLPGPESLTTPEDFATLFPGSAGSLYGRSPHGMMASFQRPVTASRIPGLYLAGGGVHPGAGLPMALSSGRHAAEAILRDRASTLPSRRTAMPGGMSMDFPTTDSAVSRSSGS